MIAPLGDLFHNTFKLILIIFFRLGGFPDIHDHKVIEQKKTKKDFFQSSFIAHFARYFTVTERPD